MRQRRLVVLAMWAALLLSGCVLTFRLGVEPVLSPRIESWITGAELRDQLTPLGYTFRYDGARWNGGRSDLPDPEDAIWVDEGDGPARVGVWLSSSQENSLTAALDVARMLGIDSAVMERVTYAYNVGLGSGECASEYLPAGHAGSVMIVRYSSVGLITFTPTDMPVLTPGCGGSASPSPSVRPSVMPGAVEVPDVRRLTEADAFLALLHAGFTPGARSEAHDVDVPPGLVAGTQPDARSELVAGSAVDIVVSLGALPTPTPVPTPELVRVPDLRRLLEVPALSFLESAGLRPGARYEVHDAGIRAGEVVGTEPRSGLRVAVGSSVDYVVSLGLRPGVPTPTPVATAAVPPTARPASTPTLSDGTQVVEVSLTDALTIEPDRMTVFTGTPVRFVVTNVGAVDHDFFIGSDKEQLQRESGSGEPGKSRYIQVPPGETVELTMTFAKAGMTIAGCPIPGHYSNGMKASVSIVEPPAAPVPTPTPPTPSQAPAPDDYVCDASSTAIQDPLGEGWNLRRIDWSNRGLYDRLIVTLDQRGDGGNGTEAIARVLPTDEVPSTLHIALPQAGNTAIALGLFQDVRLTWSLDRALTLPALKWITMEKDDNGFPWVVLGVKGEACYSLQVPAWTEDDPQPATTVLVTIDVQH